MNNSKRSISILSMVRDLGIPISDFSYNTSKALVISSEEIITDAQIDTLNNSTSWDDIAFARGTLFHIYVTFSENEI